MTTASPLSECACVVVPSPPRPVSTPSQPPRPVIVFITLHIIVCVTATAAAQDPPRTHAARSGHSPCILHSQCGRSSSRGPRRTRTWSSIPSTEARSDLRTRFKRFFPRSSRRRLTLYVTRLSPYWVNRVKGARDGESLNRLPDPLDTWWDDRAVICLGYRKSLLHLSGLSLGLDIPTSHRKSKHNIIELIGNSPDSCMMPGCFDLC